MSCSSTALQLEPGSCGLLRWKWQELDHFGHGFKRGRAVALQKVALQVFSEDVFGVVFGDAFGGPNRVGKFSKGRCAAVEERALSEKRGERAEGRGRVDH